MDFGWVWSFGHSVLKLPRNFFREYTFAEFNLLYQRWKESEYSAEYRASLVATNASNPYRGEEPLPYDHFVRPQFRPTNEPPEDQFVIPQLDSTPEELRACFGPDFYAGGVR